MPGATVPFLPTEIFFTHSLTPGRRARGVKIAPNGPEEGMTVGTLSLRAELGLDWD